MSREEWLSTKVLLDRGADIEAKDTYGATPLHDAVLFGNVENVKVRRRQCSLSVQNGRRTKVLLDRGADIEAKAIYDRTPLSFAAMDGYFEVVKVRRRQCSLSVKNGRRTKVLLDRGADIESKTTAGWTPLHQAAEVEAVKVCRRTRPCFLTNRRLTEGPP